MKKKIAEFLFRIIGWKIVGQNQFVAKCIIVAVPHTSNWDFFYGRIYAYIVGLKPKYLAKSELFLPIIKNIIYWNGGIPVFRNKKNDLVKLLVNKFKKNSHFQLAIAPEGTRSYVKKWKTGFYNIALSANVPIVLMKIDYKKKEIGVCGNIMPSGDYNSDIEYIQKKYHNVNAKYPNNFNKKFK